VKDLDAQGHVLTVQGVTSGVSPFVQNAGVGGTITGVFCSTLVQFIFSQNPKTPFEMT
jgi:hypothetical protein